MGVAIKTDESHIGVLDPMESSLGGPVRPAVIWSLGVDP